MEYVTIKELADLKNCTRANIHKLINKGVYKTDIIKNSRNNDTRIISVDQLEDELRIKYYNQKGIIKTEITVDNVSQLESMSLEEREECSFWINVIEEWLKYRSKADLGHKLEVDKLFVTKMKLEYPDVDISYNILNRKWNFYQKKELKALIDKRGKARKGITKIDEYSWQVFLSFYLDQAKHSMRKSYQYMWQYLMEYKPELLFGLPSYYTFRRHLETVPESVIVLSRDGEKAYDDKCGPYISRDYTDMHSNEYWIGDNHTIDVIVGDDQKNFRIYLTAFMDARSGIFTGFNLTTSASSQSSIIALRRGIIKHGIPETLYLDNGREFLTFDFGGLGHRAKRNDTRFNPETILERLGIKMTNALVRNARAKTVERRFLDFKNSISRLFATYTGGNVVEKPDILKVELKNGNVPEVEKFVKDVEKLIEYYLNYEEYNGAVTADKGLKKIEVYNKNKTSETRVASAEQLNLLLMRSTRSQKVGRNGVYLNINGVKYEYFNTEMTTQLFGKQVYLRYDPEDLSTVRIYDLEDRFIMEAESKIKLAYGANMDDVKKAISEDRKARKTVKALKDKIVIPDIGRNTALELMLKQADRNKELEIEEADITHTILVSEEDPLLIKFKVPDLELMSENALKRKGGNEYA